MSLDQETIKRLLARLAEHRINLKVYLDRQAMTGIAPIVPEIFHGIAHARAQIARIKALLRENGIEVEDAPDDEALEKVPQTVIGDTKPSSYTITISGSIQGLVIGDNSYSYKIDNVFIVDLSIDAAVPDKTTVNETFDLAVLVRPPSLAALQEEQLDKVKTGEASVFWPDDQPYVSLRVKVRAPNCTVHDADTRAFRLYPRRASPILFFHLMPRRLGIIGIVVELYQEDDEIGSTYLQTASYEQPVGEVKINIMAETKSSRGLTTASKSKGFAIPPRVSDSDEEIVFQRLLLREKQRRQEKLELESARKGHNTEPEVLNEIEDLKKEIEKLREQLE